MGLLWPVCRRAGTYAAHCSAGIFAGTAPPGAAGRGASFLAVAVARSGVV